MNCKKKKKESGKNPKGLSVLRCFESLKFLLHFKEADTRDQKPCIMGIVHTKEKKKSWETPVAGLY